MPKQSTDDAVHGGADVADVGDGAADSAGVGGGDQPADGSAIVYLDRREFLIAAVSDTRNRYVASMNGDDYYGLAATEHQFRKALCEMAFPDVCRINRNEMQAMMADELKVMGAA